MKGGIHDDEIEILQIRRTREVMPDAVHTITREFRILAAGLDRTRIVIERRDMRNTRAYIQDMHREKAITAAKIGAAPGKIEGDLFAKQERTDINAVPVEQTGA